MRFRESEVAGCWIVEPTPVADARGRFMRAWCSQEFEGQGLHFLPVQANMGLSLRAGTIRGMHLQIAPALEAKLVRCTRGRVFDVVVDLRNESPTRGRWLGVELSADDGRMVYVPERCAHGFQALEDDSEIYYLTSAVYAPAAATGVRFDDPAIGIRWPVPVTVVSEQDRSWPLIQRLEDLEW